jgi:hypothetical protein
LLVGSVDSHELRLALLGRAGLLVGGAVWVWGETGLLPGDVAQLLQLRLLQVVLELLLVLLQVHLLA